MLPDSETPAIFRIRLHGRGGQGMKTASRILGTAFFLEGFQVQDAPRYGAERRGAPIFAFVRASLAPVSERGMIHNPDLVIIADETLVAVPPADVLHGVNGRTVVLVHSEEPREIWKERLPSAGMVLTLAIGAEVEDTHKVRFIGAVCAGAASRLVGVISASSLEQAIREEFSEFEESVIASNLDMVLAAYDLMLPHAGCVVPGEAVSAAEYPKPDWVDPPFDKARISVPAVFAPITSELVRTGLWRTVRPVMDLSLCARCLLCGVYCPEGCITVDERGFPQIDYDHCKGCLICMAQCPSHAIMSKAEHGGGAEGGVK